MMKRTQVPCTLSKLLSLKCHASPGAVMGMKLATSFSKSLRLHFPSLCIRVLSSTSHLPTDSVLPIYSQQFSSFGMHIEQKSQHKFLGFEPPNFLVDSPAALTTRPPPHVSLMTKHIITSDIVKHVTKLQLMLDTRSIYK